MPFTPACAISHLLRSRRDGSPMKTTFVGVVSAALALRYLHKLGQSLPGGRHGSDTIAVTGAALVSSTNTVAIGSVAWPGNSMSIPDAVFVIFSGFFDTSASRNAPVTLRGTWSRWKVVPGQVKSSM